MCKLDKIEELLDLIGLLDNFFELKTQRISGTLYDKFVESYTSTTVKNKVISEIKEMLSSNLSDSEVDGLIDFYKSKVGQSFIKKEHILKKKSNLICKKISNEMTSKEILEAEFDKWKIAMGIEDDKQKSKKGLN